MIIIFLFLFFLLFPPCGVLHVLLVERLVSSRLLMPGTAGHRPISRSRICDGVAQRKLRILLFTAACVTDKFQLGGRSMVYLPHRKDLLALFHLPPPPAPSLLQTHFKAKSPR